MDDMVQYLSGKMTLNEKINRKAALAEHGLNVPSVMWVRPKRQGLEVYQGVRIGYSEPVGRRLPN